MGADHQTRRTVAIVGCGPKGLYALDSLYQAARRVPGGKIQLHVFEMSPFPGAGAVYDPTQPEVLLMNFPARQINAWTKGRGPDLLSWLAQRGTPVRPDAYVPRALVGRYLSWGFDQVVAGTPPNVDLTLHSIRVSGLERTQDRWRLAPSGVCADDVLICTGHQDWHRERQTGSDQMIPSPFPTDQALSSAHIPAGATVVCKGFALTFIDVMLALTEGRGGRFAAGTDGYAYHPSGREPARIAPFSRTRRPMRAKVDAQRFAAPVDDAFWRAETRAFGAALQGPPGMTFRDDVWPALQKVADRALAEPYGAAGSFFQDWCRTPFSAERCRQALCTGYQIATGSRPADIGWALAEAWRRCYPALVRWVSHRDFSADDASAFRQVAAEMERLAFGPPAQNVGKLICLEKAGLVCLETLSGAGPADVTLDATIPAAGCADLSEPLAGLLCDGHVSAGALGGICVTEDAQAITAGGVTPGLSVIGRATEGCVLGNDTLSRTLHDLPERWAARILRCDAARRSERMGSPA